MDWPRQLHNISVQLSEHSSPGPFVQKHRHRGFPRQPHQTPFLLPRGCSLDLWTALHRHLRAVRVCACQLDLCDADNILGVATRSGVWEERED